MELAPDDPHIRQVSKPCLTCTFWHKPPEGARKPIGRCGITHDIAHGGYTCRLWAPKMATLARILGLTEDEMAWLKANPDDVATRAMRLELSYAHHTGEHDNFVRRLRQWRIWRRVRGRPPEVTTGE